MAEIPAIEDQTLTKRLHAAEAYRIIVLDVRTRVGGATAAAKAEAANYQDARQSLGLAESKLRGLKSGRGAVLAKECGVTLYEFWLELPGFSGPVGGATATLTQHGDIHQVGEVTGTTKSGLGGAVVGGLLLGPLGAVAGLAATRKNTVKTNVRTVDTRRFELQVSGPGFAWSTMCSPESENGVRSLRDLINARGTSREDIRALTTAQVDVVAREEDRTRLCDAELRAANSLLRDEQAAYERTWGTYVDLRLPILSEMRARWQRSGWLARGAALLFGPILGLAWLVAATVAHKMANETLTLVSYGIGTMQIVGLLLLTAHYSTRVRLRK